MEEWKNKKEVLEVYKYAYKCKECKRLYGSDEEDESSLCPECEKKK